MGGRTVFGPDGRPWTVRRRWAPWRPRWRWTPPRLNHFDWLDAPLDFDLEGFLVVLGAILVLALLIFFIIPALIFLVELILFLIAAFLVAFLRSLLRRSWVVEAVRDDPDGAIMRWRVVGFMRSRRVIDEIAQGLQQGQRHIQPLEAERLEEPSPLSETP
jgi:hypothetical protein